MQWFCRSCDNLQHMDSFLTRGAIKLIHSGEPPTNPNVQIVAIFDLRLEQEEISDTR